MIESGFPLSGSVHSRYGLGLLEIKISVFKNQINFCIVAHGLGFDLKIVRYP